MQKSEPPTQIILPHLKLAYFNFEGSARWRGPTAELDLATLCVCVYSYSLPPPLRVQTTHLMPDYTTQAFRAQITFTCIMCVGSILDVFPDLRLSNQFPYQPHYFVSCVFFTTRVYLSHLFIVLSSIVQYFSTPTPYTFYSIFRDPQTVTISRNVAGILYIGQSLYACVNPVHILYKLGYLHVLASEPPSPVTSPRTHTHTQHLESISGIDHESSWANAGQEDERGWGGREIVTIGLHYYTDWNARE